MTPLDHHPLEAMPRIQTRTPLQLPSLSLLRPIALAMSVAASLVLWGCASGSAGAGADDGVASAGEGQAAEGPRIVQAGAPGEASRVLDSEAIRTPEREVTPPDILFTEYMIEHHLQALEMAELVPHRTTNEQIRLLAERIDASQEDEIRLMRRWLERHAPHRAGAHEGHGQAGRDQHGPGAEGDLHDMPGMLTPEEMRLLSSASGGEFDRLFLELMIKHHEGAILMVQELFSTPGAGQEPELYQFAAHVESDQAIEIGRMLRMLTGL